MNNAGWWDRGIVGWVKRLAMALVLTIPLSPHPTVPRLQAQETSLTVYSDGRVLVRRSLPVAVARGTSTIAADLGMRDVQPGSIVALDEGVQVRGARMFAGVGMEASLRRLIGQEVLFRTGPDSAPSYVRGILLSVDPPTVRVGGHVMYGFPGTPVFPDSLVQLNPRYDLIIEAERAANALRLLYMSSGISWSASYSVLLPRGGAGQAGVTGMAQINNGASLTLGGVQVQLLAGVVRRAQPQYRLEEARVTTGAMQASQADSPSDESVGGTHVYTLPGTVDFSPGETRVIALFQRAAAAVEPELVLRTQNYGIMNQWPDAQRDLHPEVGYRIRRPVATPFGATPIPAGIVRVFEPDSAGRQQLVGEVNVDHTPAGRDLRVTTGTAFDVTAQRTQTAFEQRGQREAVSAYRVELQNAKNQAVNVLVTDMCPGRCEVLSSSIPAEQGSVNTVGFRVTVPAGGSATLDYRIRARW